jgi:hypothetical protein
VLLAREQEAAVEESTDAGQEAAIAESTIAGQKAAVVEPTAAGQEAVFAEPVATEQEAAVAEQIHRSLESLDKVSLGMWGALCAWTIPLRFILNSLESEALISDTALAILRLVSYSTSCL